ncbi:MAG: dimethyl sulfoxide reductase anchor subunit [Acidobacteriota bacterium]|nr:dimethyl sulfoxide reductase anchor subunit [Acidobacteriota bacterium]
MELPLLTRADQPGSFVTLSAPDSASAGDTTFCGANVGRAPLRTPDAGEQYRFHFDMTKCIGCKCCVVACNEQNGNPSDIFWRRVGEVEGGVYPHTQRHYLSIGCNHCLEPTCMTGCPVDAYSKDGLTGIVRHSADACIGCQYCTWNCSYGVPQFNAERGVVGKCDMCYGRLENGQHPACVVACPEDAIQIEIVRVEDWQREYREHANSPGMPSADDSISTTRITLPRSLPENLGRVDLGHLQPESPHWPLVFMTVLTQLSVGVFAAVLSMQAFTARANRFAGLVALVIAFSALSASTLHLGRPLYAARALKMWRRSWLSREVLLFTLFAGAATLYALCLWMGISFAIVAGALTVVCGLAGVGASARLYLAPGRPAWNSPLTVFEFFATTSLFGAAGFALLANTDNAIWLVSTCTLFCVLVPCVKFLRFARSSSHQLYGTWQLLSTTLSNRLILRFALLIAGLWAFGVGSAIPARVVALLLFLAAEFLGRYLFFVSVVPTNIASGFLMPEAG